MLPPELPRFHQLHEHEFQVGSYGLFYEYLYKLKNKQFKDEITDYNRLTT